MGQYRNHKNANFGVSNEDLRKCQNRVTFLSFDRWLTFYNADPEHWMVLENSNSGNGKKPYRLPVYKINTIKNADISGRPYQHWEYHYIKFLTRKDFWAYIRFIRNAEKTGEDYQNSQEILILADAVRKESAKRIEALRKEREETIRRNKEIIDNIDKGADLINFMTKGG